MLRLNMPVTLVIMACFLKLFNMRKIILIKVRLMNNLLWMRINKFIIKEDRVVLILEPLVLPAALQAFKSIIGGGATGKPPFLFLVLTDVY